MPAPSTEPVGLDLDDRRRLFQIAWADGATTALPYRALRLACHCAVCVEELTGRQLLDPATVPEDVGIARDGVEEVGAYGVRIRWTDGHGTGIYTWERLRRMA